MEDINRFKEAQKTEYSIALAEIWAGRKRSCWMWYIFPQLKSLGRSRMAKYYGIRDLQEAKDYLADKELRAHLLEISSALLALDSNDALRVMGAPDNLKLQSSMTLFLAADPKEPIFQKVLDKFFRGERDQNTLRFLGM